ncbi:MAG: metal ABC transporter permease [Muribaculaceae bacterium]|nr:metal ABC transporter permease [Muribaculaceae bacterium]MDE6316207.1 metal ABC transporter permease [Muribaculaceae bacterium]
MLELLDYTFFRNAILAVAIMSVAAGILGSYVVARRMTSLCGGITHACFGGLGLGYFLGIAPLLSAGVFAVASAVAVEWLTWRGRVREDSAIAVVWALGMAIGVYFVFITPGSVPELNSLLFGNILTVTAADLSGFAAFTAVLVLLMAVWFRRIEAVAFDSDFARVAGLPVRAISVLMTVLVSVGIVLMIRCVGIMLLMAMLTLPQLAAECVSRRFSFIVVWSAVFSLLSGIGGLMAATAVDVPPAALIVFIQAALYAGARLLSSLRRK